MKIIACNSSNSLSEKIADHLKEKDCIFLTGEIGVGKTTFTRYLIITITIFYFVPLFYFILPFTIGMLLVLLSTLLHELDHYGQTLPTISHSTTVIISILLDLGSLIFLCSIFL